MTPPAKTSSRRRALRLPYVLLALVITSLLSYAIAVGAQQFLPHGLSQQFTQLLDLRGGDNSAAVVQVTDPPPEQAKARPAANQPPPPVPENLRLLMMIRSTLIALNQANATANYSVFRALAAPRFQQINSPERLAQVFGDLRRRNLDLMPLLVLQPTLVRKPGLTAQGMLRLTGYFPSRPEHIRFDLLYQPVGSRWLLFGVSVDVAPPKEASAAPEAAAPAAQPASPPSAPVTKAAAPAKPAAAPAKKP